MENTVQTSNYYNAAKITPLPWALYIFVSSIPLIGLICLLVWAFASENEIKKSWARGMLLLFILGLILAFLILFVFGLSATFTQLIDQAKYR